MSGTHAAGRPIAAEAAEELFEAELAPRERLAWPAACLAILLLSAGLWFVAGVALTHIVG